VRLKQATDAQELERTLAGLASGLELMRHQKRWLDRFPLSVQDAVLACKQPDSRFLSASYLREASADPLPPGASAAEREARLQNVNPQAYRSRVEQHEVAEQALAAAGVPEAVAAVASAAGVRTEVPTTPEAMRAAMEKVDAHLWRRALEVVEKQMPTAAQRDDPALLQTAWAQVEQRAGKNLPDLEEELKKRRERTMKSPVPPTEQWEVLTRAARQVVFSEEAERIANEHHVPDLRRHIMAMRKPLADEWASRSVSIPQPGRVSRAAAAWLALAEYHGISVATLRQRAKQRPSLMKDSQKQEEGGGRPPPKKQPLRDRRKRGRRE
jgi:hypothetical protein